MVVHRMEVTTECLENYDKLIRKVGELVRFWDEKGGEDGKEAVAGLKQVMEEEDWRRTVELDSTDCH